MLRAEPSSSDSRSNLYRATQRKGLQAEPSSPDLPSNLTHATSMERVASRDELTRFTIKSRDFEAKSCEQNRGRSVTECIQYLRQGPETLFMESFCRPYIRQSRAEIWCSAVQRWCSISPDELLAGTLWYEPEKFAGCFRYKITKRI